MLVSAQALTVAMFGGVGTVWGPVIGSVILIPLAEILHAEAGARIPGIQGVVHGLLKPSDLMVRADHQVQLLDLGLGALLANTEGESLVDTMSTANTLTSKRYLS